MNIVSTYNPGLTAGKVPNASFFRPRKHHVRVSAPPPLSPKEKLAVVNTFHRSVKKASVTSVPPSQFVLTPAQPVQGSNSIVLQGGMWGPPGPVYLSSLIYYGGQYCCITFRFQGLASGTYLLDISVSGGDNWQYNATGAIAATLNNLTLTPQSGHLLIPFEGGGVLTFWLYPPSDGGAYTWTKTELTKVA